MNRIEKIVFMGTPDFAVPSLNALIDNGYNVVAVVTQPDKPVGRKMILTPSPVKKVAQEKGIPVLQYAKIKNEGVEDLKRLAPDLVVTCAFGQILTQEIIDIPRLGIINVHASLLPKYRGSAPIQRAVINGDKETGVSIMKTELGIDTGDVLCVEKTPIYENETAGELFDRLSVIGATALIKGIKEIENGTDVWTPQDERLATHVKMIKKEDGVIEWNGTAEEIFNFVRGMNPWPCAYTGLNGQPLKIWKVEKSKDEYDALPGTVVLANAKEGIKVAVKGGSIKICELQTAGGKRIDARSFLAGNAIETGTTLKL